MKWWKVLLILLWPTIIIFGTIIYFTIFEKTNPYNPNIIDLIIHRNNSTYVRNEAELINKMSSIVSSGVESLQILTDFDNTLTIDDGIEGKRILNTFEMFRLCPSIPQIYKEEEYKLFKKYKPIENDPNITEAQKSEYMLEWYKAAHDLMKGIKYPRNEMNELARNMTKCCLRNGIYDFFSWSKAKNVPIIILSSGLGDALTAILEAANLVSPNVNVISNFLDIDDKDIIKGMKGIPIHSYNKNQASFQDTEFFNNYKIQNRKNVILMGDMIGDAKMADGLEHLNNVVKIAFLSKKRSKNLQIYLEKFDIALYDDQTLDFVKKISELIF